MLNRMIAICSLLVILPAPGEAPKMIEEPASAYLPITKPREASLFEEEMRSADRDQATCHFDQEEIDKEIQGWFDHEKSVSSTFYRERKDRWNELLETTKKDARKVLAPLEEKWKARARNVVLEFRKAEENFYAGNPGITVNATFRHEGEKRGKDDKWSLEDRCVFSRVSEIRGGDEFDSGQIIFRVAGEQVEVLKVRKEWSGSINAHIDQEKVRAHIQGCGNCPQSNVMAEIPFTGGTAVTKKNWIQRGEPTQDADKQAVVEFKIGQIHMSVGTSASTQFNFYGKAEGPITAGKLAEAD